MKFGLGGTKVQFTIQLGGKRMKLALVAQAAM
jgi:hypothetical protein